MRNAQRGYFQALFTIINFSLYASATLCQNRHFLPLFYSGFTVTLKTGLKGYDSRDQLMKYSPLCKVPEDCVSYGMYSTPCTTAQTCGYGTKWMRCSRSAPQITPPPSPSIQISDYIFTYIFVVPDFE